MASHSREDCIIILMWDLITIYTMAYIISKNFKGILLGSNGSVA